MHKSNSYGLKIYELQINEIKYDFNNNILGVGGKPLLLLLEYVTKDRESRYFWVQNNWTIVPKMPVSVRWGHGCKGGNIMVGADGRIALSVVSS